MGVELVKCCNDLLGSNFSSILCKDLYCSVMDGLALALLLQLDDHSGAFSRTL